MTVGTQATAAMMDNTLTQLAIQMRNIMQQVENLNLQVNGGGGGFAYMEGIGYSSADATTALNYLGYMNTVAGVYNGTVQQGGSGGTGASDFNFNQGLAPLWAAQL